MGKLQQEFNDYRTKMNGRISETANTNMKRFLALDNTTYADGALDVKTKEMLGLVSSHLRAVLTTNLKIAFLTHDSPRDQLDHPAIVREVGHLMRV